MHTINLRMITLRIFCLSCLIVFPKTSLAMDVSTLADICETMENAIIDVSVDYEWELVPPTTKEDIAGTGNLIAEGPKRHSLITKRPFTKWFLFTTKATYMNEHGDSHDEMKKLSYNGDTSKLFQKTRIPSESGESLRGTISRSTRFLQSSPISLTPIGFTVLRLSYSGEKVPLSQCLRYKEGALVRIDNSIQTINDCNSICVDLLQEYTKQVCLKIYFSIDHNYTPVRYEYINGSEVVLTFDITSLEKVGNGLWFPSSGQSKTNDSKEQINRFRTTSKVKINQGLKDDIFAPTFPADTKVQDEISGKQYTIKPTEEQVDQTLNGK